MSFTFNTNIPAANDNPSVDQPDMLGNNVSTNGILAVDHISFNTANGGTHLQMHLPIYTTPTVINGIGTEGSVIYTSAGTADAAHPQAFFKNNNITYPMSLIKAYAYSDSIGTLLNSYNVTSITKNTGGGNIIYNIVLPANVTSSTNYGILATPGVNALNPQVAVSFAITGITTFNLNFRNNSGVQLAPDSFTFLVLQI